MLADASDAKKQYAPDVLCCSGRPSVASRKCELAVARADQHGRVRATLSLLGVTTNPVNVHEFQRVSIIFGTPDFGGVMRNTMNFNEFLQ